MNEPLSPRSCAGPGTSARPAGTLGPSGGCSEGPEHPLEPGEEGVGAAALPEDSSAGEKEGAVPPLLLGSPELMD